MDSAEFKPTVYIISDSTGETAQNVVNAALVSLILVILP